MYFINKVGIATNPTLTAINVSKRKKINSANNECTTERLSKIKENFVQVYGIDYALFDYKTRSIDKK